MPVRRTKLLLDLSILCLLLGTAVVVVWALFSPCNIGLSDDGRAFDTRVAERTDDSLTEHQTTLSLAQFESFWELPLRRPLYDPTPPKPAPTPKRQPATPARKPPAPLIRLMGTIVEPGHSMAIVQTSVDGKIQLKAVGDDIGPDGAKLRVERVEPDLLLLRHEEVLISVPLEPKKNAFK